MVVQPINSRSGPTPQINSSAYGHLAGGEGAGVKSALGANKTLLDIMFIIGARGNWLGGLAQLGLLVGFSLGLVWGSQRTNAVHMRLGK